MFGSSSFVSEKVFLTWSESQYLNFLSHRQCGVHDPSWAELRHFVWFLDTQIKACEKSIFCNEDIVGDVMSGLKTFVVKFMIRMSKVRIMVPIVE